MSIELTLTDHEGKPLDLTGGDIAFILIGDGRPLARGVPCGEGKIRFDADVERVKRISVRTELPLP